MLDCGRACNQSLSSLKGTGQRELITFILTNKKKNLNDEI